MRKRFKFDDDYIEDVFVLGRRLQVFLKKVNNLLLLKISLN